jgi:hypothetical protein
VGGWRASARGRCDPNDECALGREGAFPTINAVSARSATFAIAVGYRIDADTSRQQPVVLRWDGNAWTVA